MHKINLIDAVPGVPYNVSIAAVNRAGIGKMIAFENFTQQLGTDVLT